LIDSAPLISSLAAPIPAGGAAEWIAGSGGVRLRAALFPVADARGSVVLSPGRTEPIEKYFEVVEELRARRLSVLVHDWRGHGLSTRLHSDPVRGHAVGWRPFLEDHRKLLDAFAARLPDPWIALGHSMGAGLVALALMQGEARFSGAVLSSPMMGVQLDGRSPRLVRRVAAVLRGVGAGGLYARKPGDPLGGRFEDNVLTHDRGRWERTRALLSIAPELHVGEPTWAWLEFALELSLRLATGPTQRLALPLTLVAAEQERLVDNAATRAFAERVGGARYVELEGAFHEILMETDAIRARFWAEFDALAEPILPQ